MTTTELPSTATDSVRLSRALTVAGATAAALAVWAVAVPAAGAHLTVHTSGKAQPVGPAAVVIAALLAGLAAWALLAILERLGRRARRTWTVTASVVLVLSLAGPFGNGAHAATAATLVAMHLAVAAVLIPMMRRTARR